jgi:competence protein CoiA
MQFAVEGSGKRIEAAPGLRAACPGCGFGVIPKCGGLKIKHWAHESGADCDPWFEPETEWHRGWKAAFPAEHCEVSIGPHRADIHANGWTIELQHSSIAPEEIAERERFYRQMIWVVDAAPFLRNLSFCRPNEYVTLIRWKWARPCWARAKCPVFLDTRDGFLVSMGAPHWEDRHSHQALFQPAARTLRKLSGCAVIPPVAEALHGYCRVCRRNAAMSYWSGPCSLDGQAAYWHRRCGLCGFLEKTYGLPGPEPDAALPRESSRRSG